MYEVSFVTGAQELIDNPDRIVNMILRKETKKIVIPVYHMRKLEELQHSPDPKVAERARQVLRNVDTLRKMKKLEIKKETQRRWGLIYLSAFIWVAFFICFVIGLIWFPYLMLVGFPGMIGSQILYAVLGGPVPSEGAGTETEWTDFSTQKLLRNPYNFFFRQDLARIFGNSTGLYRTWKLKYGWKY